MMLHFVLTVVFSPDKHKASILLKHLNLCVGQFIDLRPSTQIGGSLRPVHRAVDLPYANVSFRLSLPVFLTHCPTQSTNSFLIP
jgi:hypothetical protein